jgi:hypothetical protein
MERSVCMGIHISIEQMMKLLPLLLPAILLQLILIITALVSILRKEASFEKKLIWLIVALVVTFIGPILYFAIGSKQLESENN